MKTKVTMQAIADRLNLSKNSVSQALTGKAGVSDETRQLIQKTAEEMGYTYSRRGQSPEPGAASRTIALLASDFAFSKKGFFGDIYLSIDRELKRSGCELVIQSVSPREAEALELPAFLEQKTVDGVLILSHITNDYLKAVLGTGIPAVLIDHHHPELAADSILTNNRFSAYEAVRHLHGLGHRRIGFVGSIEFSPSYYERLEGVRLAAWELGLELPEPCLLTDVAEDSDEVRRRLEPAARLATAWFCVNDGYGFMTSSALQQLGLSVPGDASVVSFDNGYLSRLATPPITTVDVDLPLYASCAVEQLLRRLDDPSRPRTETLLPTRLVVRESTAPPAK
ncbi:DNA-binding transcriptional regulator [Paenibacillus pasadenensis]|uniref:DNA-binding transcriptional regulator n=1 Tax=Paenibacillus pasadenensis TaxID=217090 RepID=A0A2N5NB72_9BACL|nr:LacI family DNA-binding transcriptional regulator [Paenibacillus pasadenensis]PLT47592.1 DNA-binding transcriptional regulator [Paenibacillus pasadenensis]